MKKLLKLLGTIIIFIVVALSAYALIMVLFLKGCSLAIHGSPKTEKELKEKIQITAEYLENKYPDHEFSITAENDIYKSSGVPDRYQVKITAEDENGVVFNVYEYKDGLDDDYEKINKGEK